MIDFMPCPTPAPVTDRKQSIRSGDWSPHYTDPRYRGGKERTIFGAERDGIGYDYADRLCQYYGSELVEAAADIASQYETPKTAAWVDLYLSCLTTKDCTVHHILSQVGLDGYPYRIYGYEITRLPV